MTSLDYNLTRMRVEERHHAAEHRRMVRQARLEAKALSPAKPSPPHLGAAAHALRQLSPWRALPCEGLATTTS